MNSKRGKTCAKKGTGIINSIINSLPFEAHLPGYRYCGPGTKLKKRLERGDPGINILDEACKQHDIAYEKNKDTASRNLADKILAEKAWSRVKSSDASFGERLAARLVTAIMKGKVAIGAGKRKPKRGGILPLIPIIAALGAAAGGAAQIASAVNKKKAADKQLAEIMRHNRLMETKGQGLKKRKKTPKNRRKPAKKRKENYLSVKPLTGPLAAVSNIVKNLKKGRGRTRGVKKNSKNCGNGLYLHRKKP